MNKKLQTDVGMLPQSQPLEALAADNPGQGRNGQGPRSIQPHTAAVQHGRGEPGGKVNPSASRTKAQADAQSRGVDRVRVLDRKGDPLMPCHPARARKLLKKGRAKVHKQVPYTIRIIDREDGEVQEVRIKVDPGSKVTGIAIVREEGDTQHVLHLAEITHKGASVHKRMEQRANYRGRRRSANLRYRAPRFNNRKHKYRKVETWLPPSLQSRVGNITSWIARYQKLYPISSISVEQVRFDTQKLQDPEISGVEYQRGTLAGYEAWEYLLEKWDRECAYCDVKDVPLQREHIVARARGGSNRISNLTLACQKCNQKKGADPIEQFLADDPKRLAKIKAQAKRSLKDTAAVNATRNVLVHLLESAGLPVETSTGGRTKYNRSRLGIPKTHALDAACVGEVDQVLGWRQPVLKIKATGRGKYQRTLVNKYGFPRGYSMRCKKVHGFQSGDLVKATVSKGKNMGLHRGSVAVRARGSFDIRTAQGRVAGIGWRCCQLIQRASGYAFSLTPSPEKLRLQEGVVVS